MNIKEVKSKLKAKEESTIKSVECQDILELHNKVVTKNVNMSGSFEDKQGNNIDYSYNVIEVTDSDDNKSYYKVTDKDIIDSIEIGKTYDIGLLYEVYRSISKPKVTVVYIEEVTTK